MNKEQYANLHKWFMGLMCILTASMMLQYFLVPNSQSLIQERLSYETLYKIVILLIVAIGLQYLSYPLSIIIAKQLWKSEKVRTWYIRRQKQ
jgi:hypothetical protein